MLSITPEIQAMFDQLWFDWPKMTRDIHWWINGLAQIHALGKGCAEGAD